jgi:hypothetical protein
MHIKSTLGQKLYNVIGVIFRFPRRLNPHRDGRVAEKARGRPRAAPGDQEPPLVDGSDAVHVGEGAISERFFGRRCEFLMCLFRRNSA